MSVRLICLLAPLALLACTPASPAKADLAAVPTCGASEGEADAGGGYHARECKIETNGQTFDVKYADMPEGATGGAVTVEVIGSNGAVAQTLEETNVSEYLTPTMQDLDNDGHVDVLVARESGNVNTAYGVWRFDPTSNRYLRLGEVSAVEFARTADGYLATSARSSAAAWVVSFYRFDPTALTPLVSVNVEAQGDDQGHVTSTTCSVEEAPGLATLNMTQEAARTKFCAEPVVTRVFAP